MPLEPIVALNEIIVPAILEKRFPNIFINNLKLRTRNNNQQSLIVKFQHYNYETNELLLGSEVELIINDLNNEIDRVPIAKAIVSDFIMLLVLLKREQQSKNNPEELAIIKEQLGFK